jgi:tRNA(Ile)-lysidine synthase
MKPSLNLNQKLLDKTKTYLVAVSFGPDSMALLSSMIQLGYQVEVAHVNYHKRPESDLEQSQLEQFCLQHDVPLHVLDVRSSTRGNFQHQARLIRYGFFKQIVTTQQLSAILTAHHADDDLETATMQKDRQSLHDYYGIRAESDWEGIPLLRPLLQTFKANIIRFCNEHKVLYAIDASNQKPIYTRNKIRRSLSGLNEQEKIHQLDHYAQLNLILESKKTFVKPLTQSKKFSLARYLALDAESQFLFWLVKSNQEGIHFPITDAFLKKIHQLCLSQKPNLRIQLLRGWWFEKAYDDGWVIAQAWLKPYRFSSQQPPADSPMFQFTPKLLPSAFQISFIRSARPNDRLQIKDYDKSFRRLAIDWKIPRFLREVWPVVTNRQGKILTIPRYHKNLSNQANNWFEIRE